MDRLAKIAERLVQRRARSNFRSADAFVRYLRSTLIPDLRASGLRETAKDFETVVQLIKSGKVDKGFVGYLLDTLIPDLLDSGSEATADDFEEGVYWIHSKEGALSRLSAEDDGDYGKYLSFTPESGGQYYTLSIPVGVNPPKIGTRLNLKGADVVVCSVKTPAEIAAGRGGPVAKIMEQSGIAYRANCLPEGHEWLKRMTAGVQKKAAMGGSIFTHSKGIEFLYNPVTSFMQIGMGGEWWSGTIKADKNVFRHRKESVDPAYKPVTVYVRDLGHNVAFDVAGGFGYGETFIVGARPA